MNELRIGITGHTNLSAQTELIVYQWMVLFLGGVGDRPVRGVTCLACGADQLFARAVRAVGGTYEVILPAPDYRERTIPPARQDLFDELLREAAIVHHTGHAGSGRAAYAAANEQLLGRVERLLAIWDGEPAQSPASTAHVVAQARARGMPTTVLWPDGAERTGPTSHAASTHVADPLMVTPEPPAGRPSHPRTTPTADPPAAPDRQGPVPEGR